MSEPPELSIFVRTGKLPMRQVETARLLLRQFHPDDLKQISDWQETFQNENNAQSFLDFCLDSYDKWGIGPWAVVVKQTGILAGQCGFVRIHFFGNSGEVNYFIRPSHRRQGFACEALKAVLNYGFEDLLLSRIQGRCSLDNPGSERILQKAQMRSEGMVSSDSRSDPASQRLYVITRNDFNRSVLPAWPQHKV